MSHSAVASAYFCDRIRTDCTECRRYGSYPSIPSGIFISVCVQVPSGVLSVLPGPGATTGKELVSHPLIRKVDITVAYRIGHLAQF
jgi:hypothetical protein